MRRSFIALLLATLLSSGLIAIAAPAEAAVVPSVPLEINATQMVLAESTGRLFFSDGSSQLLVTDTAGVKVATVTMPSDVLDMSLSEDESSIIVTMLDHQIVVLDATTLAISATYTVPDDVCPLVTVESGGLLISAEECTVGLGGIYAYDPATDTGVATSHSIYDPIIRAIPTRPGVIVHGDLGLSPTTLTIIDAANGAVLTTDRNDGGNLADLAVTPDGAMVIQASGAPYVHNAYSTDDLSLVFSYPTTNYPNAIAVSADGSTVVAGVSGTSDDLFLFSAGSTTLINSFDVGDLRPAMVAVTNNGGRVFAVSTNFSGTIANLHIVDPPPAPAETGGGTFFDDDNSIFEPDIEALAAAGVTNGCNAQRTSFCPTTAVTRGQMAAFLVRALGLTAQDPSIDFSDDNTSIFQDDIEKLATAGITNGCGANIYCPDSPVTREQMAAFLVRALGLTAQDPSIDFSDDNTSIFQDDIEKLATAGITNGCGANIYCPKSAVTRGQMAAFLTRALNYDRPVVSPRPTTTVGTYLDTIAAYQTGACDPLLPACDVLIQQDQGDFYMLDFWYVPDWSTQSAQLKADFLSDKVRIEASINGAPLNLVESTTLEDDAMYKEYSFQYPAWLNGEHTIVIEYIDDISGQALTLNVTLQLGSPAFARGSSRARQFRHACRAVADSRIARRLAPL